MRTNASLTPRQHRVLGAWRALALVLTVVGLCVNAAGAAAAAPASSPVVYRWTASSGTTTVLDDAPAQAANSLTVGAGKTFPTIAPAIAAARPGDTIDISAGTYNETLNLSGKQGTANSYITVRAAPGAVVTVNGSVKIDGAAYLRWIGIAVHNSPTYGISGGNVRNVVFQSCEVANTRDGGLDIFSGENVLVEGCNISGTNAKGLSAGGEALSMSRTQGFDLRNNRVHDSGEEGIDTKDASTSGTVHHNDVWGNRGPNIYVDSAQNIAVYNNKVYGATSRDKPNIMVAVESYAKKRLADNINIHNNAIFNGAGSGVGFWKEGRGTISNVTVQNNSIWGNKGSPIAGAPDTGGNMAGNIEAPPSTAMSGGPAP